MGEGQREAPCLGPGDVVGEEPLTLGLEPGEGTLCKHRVGDRHGGGRRWVAPGPSCAS